MLINKPYNRERAVEYARKWALGRNPLFIDFTGIGGNCTNFVSQSVLAGSCTMNYTPDFGWYYISANDRAPAWSGVVYFYEFMTGGPAFAAANGGVGPYGSLTDRDGVRLGDVIQYRNRAGEWYHSVIVTGFEGEEILVSAQSDNALDRPLSSYNYADLRIIHIEGVRVELNDDVCYDTLLRGETEPPDTTPERLPDAILEGNTERVPAEESANEPGTAPNAENSPQSTESEEQSNAQGGATAPEGINGNDQSDELLPPGENGIAEPRGDLPPEGV